MSVKVGNVGRLRNAKRMSTIPQRVKVLRERAGLSMEEAAVAGGWKGASSYQRYEDEELFTRAYLPLGVAEKLIQAFAGRGNPQIRPQEIMALTHLPGVPFVNSVPLGRGVRIIGVVEAGVWREAFELPPEEQQTYPCPALPGYENVEVFGLQVKGPSMNKLYPDGSVVLCVRVPDVEPRAGDIVVVSAKRGDLLEATLKELRVDKKGKTSLWPQSTDPKYQKPIYPEMVGAESVDVIGIVVAGITATRPARSPRI